MASKTELEFEDIVILVLPVACGDDVENLCAYYWCSHLGSAFGLDTKRHFNSLPLAGIPNLLLVRAFRRKSILTARCVRSPM